MGNLNGLDQKREQLSQQVAQAKLARKELGDYIGGVISKVNQITFEDSGGIVRDNCSFENLEELSQVLKDDITGGENELFFLKEGVKLLEEGYKFLSYNEHILSTTSSILYFSGGSFHKAESLIVIFDGVKKSYRICETPDITWDSSSGKINSKKNIGNHLFLLDVQGEIMIIYDDDCTRKLLYVVEEIGNL